MMTPLLLLSLALLPPEAARHHDAGMTHFKAGRHDEAVIEFLAAYAGLDPRDDLVDREQLLATVRGLRLVAHERTGGAAPLCDLQALLAAHIAALETAHAGLVQPPEIAQNTQVLADVTTRLAAFPPGVCDPPKPALVVTPEISSTEKTSVNAHKKVTNRTSNNSDNDVQPGRSWRVAGAISLGVGVGLLGATGFAIARERRLANEGEALRREVEGRAITPDELAQLLDDLERARGARRLAIGAGVAAAAATGVGVALLVIGRRSSSRRVAVAPWWLSSGTGVSLSVRLR
jgi:hypothetical protein